MANHIKKRKNNVTKFFLCNIKNSKTLKYKAFIYCSNLESLESGLERDYFSVKLV